MANPSIRPAILQACISICIFFLIIGIGSTALAAPVSVELTAEGLGIGVVDINASMQVDPDIVGKIVTSSAAGEGSILTIQTDGLAGSGTVLNPLLVTVTAGTHLDTLSGLPDPNDYQAGVIYITDKILKPDKDRGLGVRAFGVDGPTGLRTFTGGLADIEGSKDVSGGTGIATYDPLGPNGPPHVDENVLFDFNPLLDVKADSITVILSKYDPTDILDLHIELTDGTAFDFAFLETTSASLTEISTQLWKLTFADLGVLGTGDQIDFFTIRANDDLPAFPKGTAEHFLINGFTADAVENSAVPEPGTLVMLLGGLAFVSVSRAARRRRRSKTP